MNQKEFEAIFERQVEQSRETLIAKALEYVDVDDRLHNFNVAAIFQGITPEEALLGMATKHFVSISDMVRKGEAYPAEYWNEKIGDAINYLILLRAVAFEAEAKRNSNVVSDSERRLCDPPPYNS